MQLSSVAVSSKTRHPTPLPTPSPHDQSLSDGLGSQTPRMPSAMFQYQPSPGDVSSSFKSVFLENSSPKLARQYQTTTPSGLSLLLANRRVEGLSPSSRGEDLPSSVGLSLPLNPQPRSEGFEPITSPPPGQTHFLERPSPQLSEGAPLLAQGIAPTVSYSSVEAGLAHQPLKSGFGIKFASASSIACTRSGELLVTCVRSLPAVLLGVLLNILDGVSCELLWKRPMTSSHTDVRWFDYIPYLGDICRPWRTGCLYVLRIVSVTWSRLQDVWADMG